MSINNLSTKLNEQSSPRLVSVMKPVELSEKSDFKTENQSITDAVQKLQSVPSGKSKDLAVDADKQEQATQVNVNEAATKGSLEQGKSLTDSLQQMTQSANLMSPLQVRKLEFSIAEESGRTVVKVIDKDNDDVIRQIPSEEFIRVAQKISDLSNQMSVAQGVLFDSKV